jgi:molybdopterin synthase catalytic subunit
MIMTLSFDEAMAAASRDEGFKATVYAMNTLLIRKGIYAREEFERLFVEWVEKEQAKQRGDPKKVAG